MANLKNNNLIKPYYVVDKTEIYSDKYQEYEDDILGFVPITYPNVRNVDKSIRIDANGNVINVKTGNYYTPYERGCDNDYLHVTLPCYPTPSNTKYTTRPFAIHRLVAYHFCNPPKNFEDLQVNHINGNRHDNRACNLEWVTSAANNQHAINVLNRSVFINGEHKRMDITTNDAHYICKLMQEGKSDTEIINILGWPNNNCSLTCLYGIRSRETWKDISCYYNIPRSSKNHAYTIEEREKIKTLILQGKHNKEIFYIMQGREYVAATDRNAANYKAIDSVRIKLRKQGYNV